MFDCCRKLRVIIVCGSSLSQSLIGNVSSTPARIALKWLLKVCIPHSARLSLWLSGGTNWIVQFFCNFFLYSSDTSFSIIRVIGFTVLDAVRRVHSARYAFIISPADLFFIGSLSIQFPSTSTNTIMYLFPLLNVVGKQPV